MRFRCEDRWVRWNRAAGVSASDHKTQPDRYPGVTAVEWGALNTGC